MEHLSVTAAQQCVLESVAVFDAEKVGLEQASGRVLAEEACANRDQPPDDMPSRTLAVGQCARIMTGAPTPQGADAVIRVEDTEAKPDNRVQINQTVKPGNDIRRLGENMFNGEGGLSP